MSVGLPSLSVTCRADRQAFLPHISPQVFEDSFLSHSSFLLWIEFTLYQPLPSCLLMSPPAPPTLHLFLQRLPHHVPPHTWPGTGNSAPRWSDPGGVPGQLSVVDSVDTNPNPFFTISVEHLVMDWEGFFRSHLVRLELLKVGRSAAQETGWPQIHLLQCLD